MSRQLTPLHKNIRVQNVIERPKPVAVMGWKIGSEKKEKKSQGNPWALSATRRVAAGRNRIENNHREKTILRMIYVWSATSSFEPYCVTRICPARNDMNLLFCASDTVNPLFTLAQNLQIRRCRIWIGSNYGVSLSTTKDGKWWCAYRRNHQTVHPHK